MKKTVYLCLCFCFAALSLLQIQAQAVTSYSIPFNQEKKLYLTDSGTVTSASWRSSDGRIVEITAQSTLSCTIRAVDNSAGNTARITCTYKVLVGGTILTKYQYFDITIPKRDSGGSTTPGTSYSYALQTDINSVYLDLAVNGGSKSVPYRLKALSSSSVPTDWFLSTEEDVPEFLQFYYSDLQSGVYYLPLTGRSPGTTTLTIQAHRRGRTEVLAETTLTVHVICSHTDVGGAMRPDPQNPSAWVQEFRCKHCGRTKAEPLAEVGAVGLVPSGNAVSAYVTIPERFSGAQALCAAYQNGALLWLRAAPLAAGETNGLLLPLPAGGWSGLKLFVVDETFKPLSAAIPVS